MSVKYTVRHNDQVIGTRKSARHGQAVYTHAVVRVDPGHPGHVLAYCSRLDLANKEASRRARWNGDGVTVVLPVEAQVTTKGAKAAPAPTSWKVEVQADSTGTWAGNGLRFATQAAATTYARDLEYRWTSVRAFRVVACQDPVEPRTAAGSLD